MIFIEITGSGLFRTARLVSDLNTVIFKDLDSVCGGVVLCTLVMRRFIIQI